MFGSIHCPQCGHLTYVSTRIDTSPVDKFMEAAMHRIESLEAQLAQAKAQSAAPPPLPEETP